MTAQNLKTVKECDFFAVKFRAHACYYTLSPQCKVCCFFQDDNDGSNSFLCKVGYLPPRVRHCFSEDCSFQAQ